MDAGRTGVRFADDLGNPCPQAPGHAELGDGHELVVVGGQPEADLPQRVRDAQPGVAEPAQIRDTRGDGASQLPGCVGTEIVERGSVDCDRPNTPCVLGDLRGGRDDIGDVGGRAPAQRLGERIGTEVDREPAALLVVHIGQLRKQRVGGGNEVRSRVEDDRHEIEEHALEQSVQVGRRDAVGRTDPQHQCADALRQRNQDGAVAVGDGLLARHGERLGDLPARLDVAQRIAAADERPFARQRRLRQGVEAGVQRPDRETLIRRRIQQALGLGRQVGRITPRRLRQHTRDRRAPSLLRFPQPGFLHVYEAK